MEEGHSQKLIEISNAFITFNEIFSLEMGHSSEKGTTNNKKKFRIGCNFTGRFYTEKYDDSPNMSL